MQRTVLVIFIFTSLTIFLATMITNSGTGSASPQKKMKTHGLTTRSLESGDLMVQVMGSLFIHMQ
jgi:hypothetical protein